MKGFTKLSLGLLMAAMLIAGPRAGAQQFGLSVTPSANSIMVSNSLTYTITVTNFGADVDTVVTNFLPASVQFLNATNTYNPAGIVSTNPVVFQLIPLLSVNVAQMTVTVLPTAAGSITNTVIVASIDSGNTNRAFTNVVVNVTNTPPTSADLGVTITGPSQVVITNDWMTYGVTVTNAGPSAAPGVILTNILPPGVIQISPTNKPATNPIPLGTMPNGGLTNLYFTVQPTNIGTLTFSASVSSSAVTDTNTANNFASTNIVVTNYLPGTLTALTSTSQTTNFIAGLLEQTITISNTGATPVPAARLIVTGLTNRLFNAAGTNNGNPFVYYSTTVPANQSVNLLLQYFPRKSFPFANSQLQAFAVPVPNWTPPSGKPGTNMISRIAQLPDGRILVEWPATLGRTYTVVYSDNLSFSNAMIAPPSIVAPANDVEWIDYGPPTTVSLPTTTTRFYRVLQNP